MKTKPRIFLSYAQQDEVKVKDLHRRLSDKGFKPWMDKIDILPGENWESAIKKAIQEADFFLICLSANSVDKRGFIQKEIKNALDIWQKMLDSDIYLIPVRLEKCEVPENLRNFQWMNLFEENEWTKLVKAIQEGMVRRPKKIKPANPVQLTEGISIDERAAQLGMGRLTNQSRTLIIRGGIITIVLLFVVVFVIQPIHNFVRHIGSKFVVGEINKASGIREFLENTQILITEDFQGLETMIMRGSKRPKTRFTRRIQSYITAFVEIDAGSRNKGYKKFQHITLESTKEKAEVKLLATSIADKGQEFTPKVYYYNAETKKYDWIRSDNNGAINVIPDCTDLFVIADYTPSDTSKNQILRDDKLHDVFGIQITYLAEFSTPVPAEFFLVANKRWHLNKELSEVKFKKYYLASKVCDKNARVEDMGLEELNLTPMPYTEITKRFTEHVEAFENLKNNLTDNSVKVLLSKIPFADLKNNFEKKYCIDGINFGSCSHDVFILSQLIF